MALVLPDLLVATGVSFISPTMTDFQRVRVLFQIQNQIKTTTTNNFIYNKLTVFKHFGLHIL